MNKSIKLSFYILTLTLISFVLFTTVSAYNGYYDYGWLGFGAACFLLILIWFIVFIAIAIWVYKDAEKRGKSGALWLVIVILLGLIGIIIWLIVRPPIGGHPQHPGPSTSRFCIFCGRQIPMDAQVCPYCGKRFEQ